ncbi:MAG TPA: hypothetical protein VFI23_16905 [Rhizomicrobium sp.]|nr:hypothetical protein [Rhizomicrobium sp.]
MSRSAERCVQEVHERRRDELMAQKNRAVVMLRRNIGKKVSNSKDLMLLKCHAAVAMIRLCDIHQA